MANLMMTVTFELHGEEGIPMYIPQAKSLEESFHEAFCQAIHEGGERALQYIRDYVVDIKVQDVVEITE